MKKIIFLVAALVAVVLVAGCTSNVSTPFTPQSNKAVDYGNNFVASVQNKLAKNESMTDSSVNENGSNQAQVSITEKNTTTSMLWAKGSTTTYAFNIKQFSTIDEATKFYNTQSFGFSKVDQSQSNTVPSISVYEQTMGHKETSTKAVMKMGTLSLVQVTASMVIQQDEFVVWGDVSVMPA